MAKEHRHRRRYAAAGHLSKGNVASSALSARIPYRLVRMGRRRNVCFWHKADITFAPHMSAFDPKRSPT